MSANTYWRPKTRGHAVNCLSSFVEVVAEAKGISGDGELYLASGDIPLLRGIAAADKSTRKAVDELIEAIEKHTLIALWREF